MHLKWLAPVATILLSAARAEAQSVSYGLGGGLLVPVVDYKDIDKVGWILGADLTYWLAPGTIGIRAEGSYSRTGQKAGACCVIDHTTRMAGGMVDVVYAFGATAGQTRPYLLAGVGFYNVKFSAPGFASSSQTKLGFGGGAGLTYRVGMGSTRVFLEAKFTTVTVNGVNLASIPIRVGLRLGT